MTKQEALNAITDFSAVFPKEAIREIQSNKADYIPELLESLDYAYHNAKQLEEDESDYFLYNYAMFLLAEFREKQAFPYLVALLRLPEDQVSFLLSDGLTEDFHRILLSTYDRENLQMLLDIIENRELYEWARLAAVSAYEDLAKAGHISREEAVSYLRSLIYDKLPPDDSEIVYTGIVGCVIEARLFEMMPDVHFLYDNDRVDDHMYGGYDDVIDWMFDEKHREKPTFIGDTVSEMEPWTCYEHDRSDEGTSQSDKYIDKLLKEYEEGVQQEKAEEMAQKKKKVGRNDPCPCGSGRKYKHCCLSKDQNSGGPAIVRLEDKFDLLEMYPRDSELFMQMYDAEAVDIDMLAYKALHHRAIPIWVKRDLEQERIGKIDYLNEALELFQEKCRREQITSFAAFDERFMVHYRAYEWVSALVDLMKGDERSEVKGVRKLAKETLERLRRNDE